jgi:Ca2+-binding EF-hand superfamily protein
MFTTQQQQGGPRYSAKTLIGNWSEDMELEQIKFKDYLARREQGQLVVHQIERKLSKSLTPVGHSFSADGKLHFGAKVMLLNKKTNGFLVCDPWDKIAGTDDEYAVTSSTNITRPVARSVFILVRERQNDGYPGDCLHYGQPFLLQVHSFLSSPPLYLHSCTVSPQHFARFSRHQEVSVNPKKNSNTIWVLENNDSKIRFETLGTPVQPNIPVLLKHNQTGQWLASDLVNYKNDYGVEYEVCTHSFLSGGKTQQLSSEKAGKLTTDIPSRNQGDQNVWMICTAADPSQEEEKLPAEGVGTSAETLISQVKQRLLERGAYGIRGLARVFQNMDENRNRILDPEDFKWGLINYGIVLSDDDVKTLVRHFDRNRDGYVNFDEFLTTLKGQMNDARMRLVGLAYSKLDKNGDGTVKLDDIAQIYNASRHPEVLQGKKTEEQVFREFISMWDTQVADGVVTLQEFARYFEDVSASIDSDAYFEAMMRSAWGI